MARCRRAARVFREDDACRNARFLPGQAYSSRDGRRAKDVSRRDFFKTVGVGSIATAVCRRRSRRRCAGPAPVGPGDVAITLTISGQRHQLERRAARHAARRHAHAARHHRTEARLRSRRLRRLHDDHRRPHVYSCSMLAIEAQGKNDSHRRRPRATATRCIRCSRRSATTTG